MRKLPWGVISVVAAAALANVFVFTGCGSEDSPAVVDPDSPGLVHEQAQHAPGSARPVLQIHERQPVIQEHRLHNLLDLELLLVFLHHFAKVKKWATPTFSRL